MNKKRTGITLCLAALVLLTGIMVFQGIQKFPQLETENVTGAVITSSVTESAVETQTLDELPSGTGTVASGSERTEGPEIKSSIVSDGNDRTPAPTGKSNSVIRKASETKQPAEPEKTTEPKKPTRKKVISSEKKEGNNQNTSPTTSPSASPPMTTPDTTASVPAGTPKKKVRLTIQCTSILNHRELWKDGVEEVIPDDGIFFSGDCDFVEGDTVYDVLKKVCQEKSIVLDSQYTPVYGTYYIQGIGNLYEFDCGNESGWKYTVNGKMPAEGCSSYKLTYGDDIVFYYDYQL